MRWPIGKIQLRILGILLLIIAILTVALIRNAELPTFIIGGLLALITLFVALLNWVNRPLRLLARSLRTQNPALLEPLSDRDTEFGQLAQLVRDFFQQQQRLTVEITERQQAEQRLRLFSRAIENSANLVVITDCVGAIEYVNPQFTQVTGYTAAEVLGANPRLLKSGKTPPEQYQQLWRTLIGGHEWRGEFRNRRKDGTLYWESASIAPIRDEKGAITHFIAIKEDITRRKKMEAALRASEVKYRGVFATVGDALLLVDSRDGRILDVNPATCKLYGYSREELLALRDRDLAADAATHIELLSTPSTRRVGHLHHRKDGTVFQADIYLRRFTYQGHKITVEAVRDMTPQKRAEQKILRLSHCYAALSRISAAIIRHAEPQELFQQVCQIVADLEQMQIATIGFVDSETGGFQPAAHAGAVPDYPRYLASTHLFDDPSVPDMWEPTGMAFRQGSPVVNNDFPGDPNAQGWRQVAGVMGIHAGAAFPLRRNGRVVGCLSAYASERNFFETDITDLLNNLAGEISFALDLFDREARRKSAELRIHQMATHDPLTGLPNRNLLLDRLAQALHSAHRKQRHVGVLFLDLDHFKTINDSLGHEVGDRLLQEVTERLRHCIRQEDTLARQGGDEFILVLPDITDPAAAGHVAEHLLRALHEPFILNDQRLHIGASIGVSIYPLDATDPPTLIRFADSAMYQAKEAGRASYAFFTVDLNHRVSERFALSNELRHALEADEFVLHYQPQFDLATGQMIGAEALIRWQHPKRGLVSPIKFISVAEETGLINAIGEWTLRTACAQNRCWQDAGLPAIPIAVNLSAKQWLQPHLEDQVIQALETVGLAPELLELEITESLLMRDTEKMIGTMRQLRARGVKFAVDDFGIGYSSLSYLKRFPINRLKIDQSFVRDIPADPDDTAITTAIIQMGKSLRLTVVAEGVETLEQLRFLREQGCDAAQGYHFSKPVPAAEFARCCVELGWARLR
jgi:diguanylate cyclase (GGDEF)-like protein/PAS domain S-box-containing protein